MALIWINIIDLLGKRIGLQIWLKIGKLMNIINKVFNIRFAKNTCYYGFCYYNPL